jgi:hypothetical protein
MNSNSGNGGDPPVSRTAPNPLSYPLRRRAVLKWMSASGAVFCLPTLVGCSDSSDTAPVGQGTSRQYFFSTEQRATIETVAAMMLPEDATVGALEAGAVEYIDRFLAAFTTTVPDIYRAGPYSGREPFPDPITGAASDSFPENMFEQVLPLSRMQELAWRREFFGSDAIANGDINGTLVEKWPGIQALYEQAIIQLDNAAVAAGFTSLSEMGEREILDAYQATDARFQSVFLAHLAEGMFGPPEYGGNIGGVSWRDYFYDGDSQPLGHTLFNYETQTLYDRADAPNQTIDDDAFNDPMSDGVLNFVKAATLAQGGKRFF